MSSKQKSKKNDNFREDEETKITAQISLPNEGGWGWVVVIASLMSIFLLDGTVFTFGSLLEHIAYDLHTPESIVVMINSVSVAIYFLGGPLASALINRFGFRACSMSGSVICSLSLFISYFAKDFSSLCIFYGVIPGFGYCLINLAASLVVGFYFERLRAFAMAVATCGSSCGVMILFPVSSYLAKLDGWRTVVLLQSGMLGLVFFLAMAYRPLISFTIVQTVDDKSRATSYITDLSSIGLRRTVSQSNRDQTTSNTPGKLFSAVSNINFPTAATVFEDSNVQESTQPGPSTGATSKFTLSANGPYDKIGQDHLKQVKSMMSRCNPDDKTVKILAKAEAPKKKTIWNKLFHWEKHVKESRPMYRDDAFYDGKLGNLPVYQKSMMNVPEDQKTGLEYQLAISRAATSTDLEEKHGVFTMAVRRVLATMMNPLLLGKCSFRFLCMSSGLVYIGYLVPYVFIQDRNRKAGMDEQYCSLLVSVIGLSNAIGRITLGVLGCKFDPIKIFCTGITIAGLSSMMSVLSYDIYFQFAYCFLYGFAIASVVSLKSMVLVTLYGLDNLTNATGILLLFQGFGSLIGTPIAGIIKERLGYDYSFIISGTFITIGGLVMIPVKPLLNKENRKKFEIKLTKT